MQHAPGHLGAQTGRTVTWWGTGGQSARAPCRRAAPVPPPRPVSTPCSTRTGCGPCEPPPVALCGPPCRLSPLTGPGRQRAPERGGRGGTCTRRGAKSVSQVHAMATQHAAQHEGTSQGDPATTHTHHAMRFSFHALTIMLTKPCHAWWVSAPTAGARDQRVTLRGASASVSLRPRTKGTRAARPGASRRSSWW